VILQQGHFLFPEGGTGVPLHATGAFAFFQVAGKMNGFQVVRKERIAKGNHPAKIGLYPMTFINCLTDFSRSNIDI
jgi:hypothetical protein